METRTQKSFEDREAELYLALEQILEEMSKSTSPQRKLANRLGTPLANRYEVYARHNQGRNGSVNIEAKLNQRTVSSDD